MIGTTEEARVSKEARVVGEVAVGKTVEEREETVRDTVRKTAVQVEEVGTKGSQRQVSNKRNRGRSRLGSSAPCAGLRHLWLLVRTSQLRVLSRAALSAFGPPKGQVPHKLSLTTSPRRRDRQTSSDVFRGVAQANERGGFCKIAANR